MEVYTYFHVVEAVVLREYEDTDSNQMNMNTSLYVHEGTHSALHPCLLSAYGRRTCTAMDTSDCQYQNC